MVRSQPPMKPQMTNRIASLETNPFFQRDPVLLKSRVQVCKVGENRETKKMEPPKLNKEQLIRLPDSRKHSLVLDWLTRVADFLRQSGSGIYETKFINRF